MAMASSWLAEPPDTQSAQSILESIRNPKGGASPTAEDKLRLVLVYYLSLPDQALTKEEVTSLEQELASAGASVGSFAYVRRTREISRMTIPTTGTGTGTATPVGGGGGGAGGGGGELLRGLGLLGNRVSVKSSVMCRVLTGSFLDFFSLVALPLIVFKLGWVQLTDRLKEGGLDGLLSGVKNLLPTNKMMRVTRLLEALMDPTNGNTQALQESDEYLMLDPRGGVGRGGSVVGAGVGMGRRTGYGEGIVFVVGGAGYVEYGNVEEWAEKTGRRVTYGGTELIEPGRFVRLLEALG